jgi:hypothetical protein
VITLRDKSSIGKMLALLSRQFDAVTGAPSKAVTNDLFAKFGGGPVDSMLLNLRCCMSPDEMKLSGVHDVHASKVGRVLVVTGEIRDAHTMEVFDRICVPYGGSWSAVRALVGIPDSPDLVMDELA